jgi:hypothetical protein
MLVMRRKCEKNLRTEAKNKNKIKIKTKGGGGKKSL